MANNSHIADADMIAAIWNDPGGGLVEDEVSRKEGASILLFSIWDNKTTYLT